MEDLGGRLRRVPPEPVHLGPTALLHGGPHEGRSLGVREEELIHEEVRNIRGHRAALERPGRQKRRHLVLDALAGPGDFLERDADHHERGLAFEEALKREAAVSVLAERLHALGQTQVLVLEGVGQLVREDEAAREILRVRPREGLGSPDDEEPAGVRIVEGHDLGRVEIEQRVQEPRRVLDQADRRERAERLLGRRREALENLGAEHPAGLGGVDLRSGDRPREPPAPDLLDAPGDLRHPIGQEVRETREAGRRQRDSGRAERAFSKHGRG